MEFKRWVIVLVLLVVLSSIVVAAKESSSCGVFCQADKYWSGLVGKGVVGSIRI